MKLSTRSRYGLRAMIALAMQYNTPVFLKEISREEYLSLKYLDHIMSSLKSAGLIGRVKGGYVLRRSPSEITAYDIVSVLESSLKVVDCELNTVDCFKSKRCAAMDLWKELNSTIKDTLSSKTLKELSDNQKEKEGACG